MSSFVGSLAKSSALALFIKIAGAFLSYVMFIALARAMDMEQFGYFSFAFSVSVILAKIAVGGQQQILLRDLARYHHLDIGRQDRDAMTMRSYLTVFVLSAALFAVLLLAAFFQDAASPALTEAMIVAAFFIPIMAFSELQTSILRAYNTVILGLVPREVVWRGLVCLVGFSVAWCYGRVMSAAESFLVCAILLAVPTLIQSLVGPGTGFWRAGLEQGALRDREWLRASGQFWVSSVVMFGAPMLAVVIIGFFLSPIEAGAFFAALKSSQTISLVLTAANIVASPLISRYFWRNDLNKLQMICSYCAGVGGIFSAAIFLLFVLTGHLVLGLFGSGFEAAYPELLILSAGYVVNAACGPNGAILEMTSQQARFMRLILFSNVIGIVALPVLTGLFGSIGAACAVTGTLILWNVLASIDAVRHASIDPTVFGVFRLIMAALKKGVS